MRISDLRDVPANAEYYSDLKVLIEQYGIIGNDLIVAREDTIAISTEPIGSLFYPKTKLTNRQFAFLFDASLGYLKDTIGGYKLPDSLDAVEKYQISMCGWMPVYVMLLACKELGASEASLVRYMTSGDITGETEQVVGYGGIIIK